MNPVLGWEQLFTGCTNRCLVVCQLVELNAAVTRLSLDCSVIFVQFCSNNYSLSECLCVVVVIILDVRVYVCGW